MLKANRTNRRRRGSRRPIWIALLLLVAALGIGIGSLVSFANTIAFVRSALIAPGTVIELVGRPCDPKDRGTCYAPRVLFTDPATGRRIEFLSRVATDPPAFRVGERLMVLYSPDDPGAAMVQGFFSIWGGVSILSGICILFAAVGGGILLFPDKFGRGASQPTLTCTSSRDDSKISANSTPPEASDTDSADFVSSDADADFASV